MKSLSLKEIQGRELAILDFFIAFCKENNLVYFADGGTLIGAVRHQGFIPWDDDIDVFMPRADYDTFISVFPANNNFTLLNHHNTKDYYYPFSKLVDSKTHFIEHSERYNLKPLACLGVGIDIFPLDYAPDNMACRYLVKKQRIEWQFRGYQRFAYLAPEQPTLTNKIVWPFLAKKGPFLSIGDYLDQIERLYRKQQPSNTLVDLWTNFYMDAAWFSSAVELDFEGRKIAAPQGWNDFLTSVFGDYMTPVLQEPDGHGEAFLC